MSITQNYTISGTTEKWTITSPTGITITPVGDAAGTLNVAITYTNASLLDNATAHGILSVDFQPIIDQIVQATHTAMADQQFKDAFVAAGFEPTLDSTPELTRRFVEEEVTRWTPVIKAIGLKLD